MGEDIVLSHNIYIKEVNERKINYSHYVFRPRFLH
jgi:predicted ATP-grasp superfamily ATP-dependent carboligase